MFEGKRGGSWCRTQVVRSPYFIIFLDFDAKTNGIFDFVVSYDAPQNSVFTMFFFIGCAGRREADGVFNYYYE